MGGTVTSVVAPLLNPISAVTNIGSAVSKGFQDVTGITKQKKAAKQAADDQQRNADQLTADMKAFQDNQAANDAQAQQDAALKARRKAASLQGFSSTILTSPTGTTTGTNYTGKTLLGQ